MNKKLLWIGAGAVFLYLILKPKDSKAETPPQRQLDTTPGADTGEPVTGSAGSASQGRTTVQKGEGWSQIARRIFGDYRWWPMLWDMNRSPTMYPTPEEGLIAGATVVLPVSAPPAGAYKDAIFARATLYARWYKKPTMASGRPAPIPGFVLKATPLPGTGPAVPPPAPEAGSTPTPAEPCAGMVNDQELVRCRAIQAQNELDALIPS